MSDSQEWAKKSIIVKMAKFIFGGLMGFLFLFIFSNILL
jgi:hypothetical protein